MSGRSWVVSSLARRPEIFCWVVSGRASGSRQALWWPGTARSWRSSSTAGRAGHCRGRAGRRAGRCVGRSEPGVGRRLVCVDGTAVRPLRGSRYGYRRLAAGRERRGRRAADARAGSQSKREITRIRVRTALAAQTRGTRPVPGRPPAVRVIRAIALPVSGLAKVAAPAHPSSDASR